MYSRAAPYLNKTNTNEINSILDGILKRICVVPPSTPIEVLHMETRLLDVETMIKRDRIRLQARLERNPNQLIHLITANRIEKGWI